MPYQSVRIPFPPPQTQSFQSHGVQDSRQSSASSMKNLTPGSAKVKKFRCELCNKRIDLIGNAVDEHKESLPHKHMQIMMEYGLWPGDPEKSPVAVLVPGLHNFDNELNGTVHCSLCSCILQNGSDLLYHQTDPKHQIKINDRSLQNKISTLYSCKVCDVFLGHNKISMETHNASDPGHLMRTACSSNPNMMNRKTRYNAPFNGPTSYGPNRSVPLPASNNHVENYNETFEVTSVVRVQSSTEIAWQKSFRRDFPWLNPNLVLHMTARHQIQKQIYDLKSKISTGLFTERESLLVAKWQRSLVILDKRICGTVQRMHKETEGYIVTFTSEYLDSVMDIMLSFELYAQAFLDMQVSIRSLMAEYGVDMVGVGGITNVPVNKSLSLQSSSCNSSKDDRLHNMGAPPPDPAQDNSQREIMDLLSSLEKTASQLSKKTSSPSVSNLQSTKERSLSEVVDECMMILDGKKAPAPAAPSNGDLIRSLASSLQNPSINTLVDELLKPNEYQNRHSSLRTNIDVADVVAKLAGGEHLSAAETASLSSLSSEKLVQSLNAGMKRAQVKEATKSWEEPRMSCVWGGEADPKTRALNERERRKELMDYYRVLEGEPKSISVEDHGCRSTAMLEEENELTIEERRPISFSFGHKISRPLRQRSRSRSSSKHSSRSNSRSRTKRHKSRSRSRSKRSHSRSKKSSRHKKRRSRSKSRSRDGSKSKHGQASTRKLDLMHKNLAPAPPTAVNSYVPPAVVSYPQFNVPPPMFSPGSAHLAIASHVPPPIAPGILALLKIRGGLLTRMMIPDQAFVIRNIIEQVATPEDLMAISMEFQKMPDQAFSDLIQTLPGVAIFVSLIRKAVNVPAAQPHLLSQLIQKQSELTLCGWAMTDPHYQLLTNAMMFCSPDFRTLIGKKLLKEVGSLVSSACGCKVLCSLMNNSLQTLKGEVLTAFKNPRLQRMLNHDYSCDVLMKIIDYAQEESISVCKELFGLDPDTLLDIFSKHSVRATKIFNRILDTVPGALAILYQNIGFNPNGLLKLSNEKTAQEFISKFWNALGEKKMLIYDEVKPQIEPLILIDNPVCRSLKKIYENGGVLPEDERSPTTSMPTQFNAVVPPPIIQNTSLLPPGVEESSPLTKGIKFGDDNVPPWKKSKSALEKERKEKRRKEKEEAEKVKEMQRQLQQQREDEMKKSVMEKKDNKTEPGEIKDDGVEEEDDDIEIVPFRKPTPELIDLDD